MAWLDLMFLPLQMFDRYFASHRNQLSEKFVFGFKIRPDLIVAQAGLVNPASVSWVFELPSQLSFFFQTLWLWEYFFFSGFILNH